MKITLLCLFLVVADASSYLEPGNTYRYDYEAVTFTGFPHAGLSRAGLKIKAKAEIEKISRNEAIINLRKAQVLQYLGEWPAGSFEPAPRIEEPLLRQLQNPVKFIYSEGDVGRIYASPEMSDTAVNVVRGVLNLLQITPSKNKRSFDIQEAGIQGVCQTRYIRQEASGSDKIVIIKARNLNNCTQNATLTTGAAYTEACPACEKISKNVQSAATIRISVQRSSSLGEVIHRVKSTEVHAFSPFHNQQGSAMTETKQALTLENISPSSSQSIRSSSMEERGGIMYKFPESATRKLAPLILTKRGSLETEIEDRLKLLSENSRGPVQSDAPLHFVNLVSLLRTTSTSMLRNVWRRTAQAAEYRRWFLDALPAIGTPAVIEFLEKAINQDEITPSEASTTLFMTLNTQEASAKTVKEVQDRILNNNHIRQSPVLRKTMLLGYGSLVRRHCVHQPTCPEALLTPLHDMLREALNEGKETKAILAIKAIANAGQKQSIEHLRHCMPSSRSGTPEVEKATIPTQAEAIIALRSIAKKSPLKVAGVVLRELLDRNVHVGLRIHSCIALLETRPSIAVLTLVAQRLQAEHSLQIAGFFYSHLRTLSRSSVPELRNLAIISNIASKIMSPNYDRLGCRYSKAVHVDAFSGPAMAGVAADVFMINGGSDIIPNSLDVKIRGYFLSHAADVVEVQLHSGGLNEILFRKPFPGEDPGSVVVDSSIQSTLHKLYKWKSMYRQTPLAAAELKLFGQNVAFGGIGEEKINALLEVLGRLQSRTSSVRSVVKHLQDGLDGTVGKGYLLAEMHRLMPVSIGIPLDVAITLAGVANMQAFVHAKFPSTLPADLRLQDILSSEMELQATGSASFSKHLHTVMALSTELFQVGLQSSTTFQGQLPLDAKARFSARDGNFKISTSPTSTDTEIVRMRTETKAFIRDLAATKAVPVLPESTVQTTSGSSSQQSSGVHYFSSEARQSAESFSQEWRSHPHMPKPIPQPSSSAEDTDSVEIPYMDSFIYAKPITRHMEACINFSSIPRKLCMSSKIRSATYIQNTLLYKLIGPVDAKIVLKQSPLTEFSSPLRSMEMEIQTGQRSAEKIDIGLVRMPSSNTAQSWRSSEETEGLLESVLKRLHGFLTDENEYAPSMSSSKSSSEFTSGSSSRGFNRTAGKRRASSSSSSSDGLSISVSASMSSREQRKHARSRPHGKASPHRMFSGSTGSSSEEQNVLNLFKLSAEEHSQSSSSSSSSSESNSISINVPSSDKESPSAVVIMRAVYENGQTGGLQTGVFYSYSPRKDRYKVHTIVASIGNRDSWKLCSEMESSCSRAKAIVTWGKECSQYAVEARLASGKIAHHSAARLDVKWARVPTWVKIVSRMAYDCSVISAYNLGMTEIAKSNPPRKISITAAALSPRIVDVIVKLPEITLFKQGMILPAALSLQNEIAFGEETGIAGRALGTGRARPGPFDCWGISSTSEALLNSTISFMQDPVPAECHLWNNTVHTFDGVKVPFNASKNCRHVLAQHCVPKMSFVIMLKPTSGQPHNLSLEMHLGDTKVEIESVHGKLTPKVNNRRVDYRRVDNPHSVKGINITKENGAIVVKAEPFGVKRLVFDGNNCTVKLSTWMRGQVCGMCGRADSERNMTYRTPSHKLAKDSESFMQSWVLMEEGCGGECPLQRQSVMMGKPNAWPHSGDKCYSTEPVLRCPSTCTPTSKQNVTVGMHCVPSDWRSEGRLDLMSNKREDMSASVEAHKGCKA
uniref:vitellogenin-like n=1 Tax=Myxine glutinosa TaxID=7769 RepID=UPI00358EB0F0